MNLNSSSWTGRAPRSLDAAFGVRSTYSEIVPMHEPLHPADKLVIRVSAFCCAVLVVIFFMEWMA